VINTGELEGLKYWPGDMGLLCNHALVFAQLLIKGEKYGVFPFIIPVRDQ
jgi:acyl-CoA oxidase